VDRAKPTANANESMNGTEVTDRRTVLQTTAAAAVGGSAIVGTANARGARPPGNGGGRRSVVEIVARHDHETDEHRLELDTGEVPSGWTTFEFDDPTEHVHFVYSNKAPQQAIEDAEAEGMDLLDFWIEAVTRPFQYFMDATFVPDKEPDPDDNTDIYESLFPPWFGDVTYYGGPGLTSGGHSSRSTVDLVPGEYILECYVKNGDNDFHSYLGMIDSLTVTRAEADASEPESTLDLALNNDGIEVEGSVRPGRHTVAVDFEEQQAYPNLVGHDVPLVRFDESTSAEEVNGWMNWAGPSQLIADGNEPGTFLGGVQDVWTGNPSRTGYFDVVLKPGDYARVAEVPDPRGKGLLQEFSVPAGRKKGRGRSRG